MIRLDVTNTGTLLPDVMYCGGWSIVYVVVLSGKKIQPKSKHEETVRLLQIDRHYIMQNNRPGLLKNVSFMKNKKRKWLGNYPELKKLEKNVKNCNS